MSTDLEKKSARKAVNSMKDDSNKQNIGDLYTILQNKPTDANASYALGKLYRSNNKNVEALEFLKIAIKSSPTKTHYWVEYIEALISLDRIKDATTVLTQARDKGLKARAYEPLLSKIRTATQNRININEPPSENIQSIINQHSLGQFKEALEQVNRILYDYPKSALLYNVRGVIYAETKNFEAAIDDYKKALAIQPSFKGPYYNLANILKNLVFTSDRSDLYAVMRTILTGNYINPIELAKPTISILKHNKTVKDFLIGDFTTMSKTSLISLISRLANQELLLTLMRASPIPDLEIELPLQKIRRSLLMLSHELTGEESVLKFLSALSHQCYINEYIYQVTDMELVAAEALNKKVDGMISSGNGPDPLEILCLTCYKPLNMYTWSSALPPSKQLRETILLQIEYPRQEQSLLDEIETLSIINNPISKRIRNQYEENPYPRWAYAGLYPYPRMIKDIIHESKLKTISNKILKQKRPKILVAGCGTGAHPIVSASRFKDSKILAVDLSKASLAYAMRKAKEFEMINITFAQSDILELDDYNELFDIIECVGVLHHMEDPFTGWEILARKLKPYGLMRIGLYSNYARQDIVKTRDDAKRMSIKTDSLSIRNFRNFLTNSSNHYHAKNKKRLDFYTLSSFRDLLLNAQEHRFNIPLIQKSLDKLGLFFCGFDNKNLVKLFSLENKESSDVYNLEKWANFESKNPDTFTGMYQFWCQKKN